ncbi:MAG: PaaI family thioesterase [Bradyrhizobiaceae bacterium]|nr:PaaI family thioesterase [Bradyrhizobiaceae bacterium]
MLKFFDNDEPSFSTLVGMKLGDCTKDRLVASVVVRPELSNRAGIMHGGAIMAIADTLGGAATVANLPAGMVTSTIESKTNFFSAIAVGDTAHAECLPLHRGRTTMVWQTKITRGDGRLAAMVTQTQIVMPAAKS